MAIREVTVEVTAKYIVNVRAGSGIEAVAMAKEAVLHGATSIYMDGVILDVHPIEEFIEVKE